MQFVLTKHTWQVVEVYHILITEVHDIDDFRIFMRQAAENLVNIGRFTIDGIILVEEIISLSCFMFPILFNPSGLSVMSSSA